MSGNAHQRRCARRAKARSDAKWEKLCDELTFLRNPFFALVPKKLKGKTLPIPAIFEDASA